MKNLAGQLLIASPGLIDPNFRRTVVLMVQDTGEGAIGLILNRPSDRSVKQLWETVFHTDNASEQAINLGGPVFGPLMMLHTRQELADLTLCDGLYFSTQKNYIERIVDGNVQPYKLFLGHSGWEEGQLQSEIDEGAWFHLPAWRNVVFEDEAELWQRLLQQAGHLALSRVLNTDELPDDPLIN